ncbi:MAG: type II secretion system F family protein [Verrucomicrobia bacterium]|nr:type II secretion system F family protein [Verrucomicrobiota bacterium]MCH8511463.1 type II secretion system F family protein [Kiritimatiellia bacterium]
MMIHSFFILAQQQGPVPVPPVSGLGVVAVFAWVITAVLGGWYAASRGTEIRYATLADGQRAKRSLPLSFRLLLPFTANVRKYHKEKYDPQRKDIEQKLVSAGYDTVLRPEEFMALKVLIPMCLGPLIILLISLVTSRLPGGLGEGIRERQWMLFISLLGYLYIRPRSWLKYTIRSRHREIERALPFILDLLTLSVEAGLDFMTALRRLIERRKVDALSEEFIRAVREMQVGRTRREALKDMADRSRQPDLASVVTALIQADELGVGIGTILRIQAEQMRQRRFQRAEKLANEAPVKLLFPLVCFIFPCVFLVLLGPIFLEMLKSGF